MTRASGSPGGAHFAKVLERLGIAAEMKPKTLHPGIADPLPPGTIGLMVANGEAEVGVNQIQELVTAAAKRLIDFLRSPEAAAVISAKGMQPAAP